MNPHTEPTQIAEYVSPPEVDFDLCGRQKLAPGFPRYIPCEGGCGYLIGVCDGVSEPWHMSCWDAEHSDGSGDAD